MRAFISYSFADEEKYFASLFATELRKKGYSVSSGDSDISEGISIDYQIKSKIKTSHLFIGIITDKSGNSDNVKKEWDYASQLDIPKILLLEKNAPLNLDFVGENIVRFDRNEPELAIDELTATRNEMVHSSKPNKDVSMDTAIAVGLLIVIGALIYLLADKKKK